VFAKTKRDDPPPTAFATQLDKELQDVAWAREHVTGSAEPAPNQQGSVYRRAFDSNLLGLAFSGGGIRSATFNLGIIQGLARLRLLHRVDYLSTVSGGGYIGGWLSAWVHRQRSEAAGPIRPGILGVEDALCGPLSGSGASAAGAAAAPEPRQVRWLREFSNYLTPQTGALSTDTLTAVATYLRNLILNQTILVAFGAALLVLPWILCALLPLMGDGWIWSWVLGTAVLLLFIGSLLAGYETLHAELGRCAEGTCAETDPKTPRVYWILFSCFAVAAVLGGIAITYKPALVGLGWAILFGCAYGLGTPAGWWFGVYRCRDEPPDPARGRRWRLLPLWAMGAAVGLGAMVYLWAGFLSARVVADPDYSLGSSPLFAVMLGPLAFLGAILLTTTLHLGLSGRRLREAGREVWNCHGAHQLRSGVIWLALTGAALFGPLLLLLANTWVTAVGGLGWVAMTIAGVLAGAGKATGGKTGSRAAELTARIAPFVFVLGVLLALSYAVYQTMWWQWQRSQDLVCVGAPSETAYQVAIKFRGEDASGSVSAAPPSTSNCLPDYVRTSAVLFEKHLWALLLAMLVLLLTALGLSWRVDINVFSLHMFYRNRLERCYLGASNLARGRRHPLTGLDPTDAPRLMDLTAPSPAQADARHTCLPQRPFPIVNTALNITAGPNLAWQERKAASFTFTPLYCGYEIQEPNGRLHSCYQRTSAYLGGNLGWISLGLPITISGAAASPNGGYHTNPATAFLMTVFNVRLGWWMPNPRYLSQWHTTGPRLSLLPLLDELSGTTSDRSKCVYLSDGGHFENLGIYELVRRRCRYVIACDAGCDPGFGFEDLGNAVRKCKIDLGIEIDLDPRALRPDPTTGYSAFHCVVGRIHYEQADQTARPGFLLYIKSSLTGDEPADILQYAAARRAFPHESTADQSYSESQFESYRKLGDHVAAAVLGDAVDELRTKNPNSGLDLEELFTTLNETWHAPSAQVATAFSKYGEALERLFEILRNDEQLRFLDAQLYPEWWYLANPGQEHQAAPIPPMLPKEPEQLRAGFYFCSSLLQFMENVYLDLNLEAQYEHPDNRGWMNLFRHWSWSGMFQVTWAITASTYGTRFQRFCRRRLTLSLGRVASRDPVSDLEQHGGLNFVEMGLVRTIVEKCLPQRASALGVVRLVLEVPSPSSAQNDPPAFTYPFAFALIEQIEQSTDHSEDQSRLVYYRVQDHLRDTGLGRKGLAVLQEKGQVTDLLREASVKDEITKRIPDADYAALSRLWSSVVTAARQRGADGKLDLWV